MAKQIGENSRGMPEKVTEPPHGCHDRAFCAKMVILFLEIPEKFPPLKSHIFHFQESGKSSAESGNFHFRQNEKITNVLVPSPIYMDF